MNVEWIDHLNIRIPEGRVDEFAAFYRDALGLQLERYQAYRDGELDFFYLRLTDESVFHVSPTDAFDEPTDNAFDHVALFVDEPRDAVRTRVEDSAAEIVDVVDGRLGATGKHPSIYVEDPFGYTVELKSPEIGKVE